MPTASSQRPSDARIAAEFERLLRELLPAAWTVRSAQGEGGADAVVQIGSKPDEATTILVQAKPYIEPRSIRDVVEQTNKWVEVHAPEGSPVIVSAYLSPRSRQLLEDAQMNYADTTGNVWITASSPDLFIRSEGADKNPWPQDNELQSLKGRGAGRALRAIIDTRPSFGVREVASTTGTSAATVSRVLELLEIEGLIERQPRGPVESVNWQEAIRRWAQDYDQTTSNTATVFLSPRGLPFIESKLKTSNFNYAATGAFAAQRFNPVAPARTASLYVEEVVGASEQLELRETEAGANVVLLEPFDPVVFDRTLERDGLRCVAPSQLAVDLLTGPGREPSQGEEILEWMKENQDAWRT